MDRALSAVLPCTCIQGCRIYCIVGIAFAPVNQFRYSRLELFSQLVENYEKNLPPSEMVVSYALRSCLPEFLIGGNLDHPLEKFIAQNSDPNLVPDWKLHAA